MSLSKQLFILCLTIIFCGGEVAAAPPKLNTKQLTAALKQRLKDSLADEASARFKDEFLSRPDIAGSDEIALCGYVNAKNLYGGSVGFKPYIVSTDGMLVTDTPDVPSATEYLWPVWCQQAIKK